MVPRIDLLLAALLGTIGLVNATQGAIANDQPRVCITIMSTSFGRDTLETHFGSMENSISPILVFNVARTSHVSHVRFVSSRSCESKRFAISLFSVRLAGEVLFDLFSTMQLVPFHRL